MTDHFLRRLRGVQHKVVAGLAGKPPVIVNIQIPNPAETTEAPIAIHDAQPDVSSAESMPTLRAGMFRIGEWAKDWLALAMLGMKEEEVDPKDVWVFLRCAGEGEPLTFTTRWRETTVGVVSQELQSGSLKCFVRFQDMRKLLETQRREEIEVTGTHLLFANATYRDEIPYAMHLPDNLVKPTELPVGKWLVGPGLWRAAHEAFDFSLPNDRLRGFSAIHVKPHHDGKNNVSVLGITDVLAYRRVVTLAGLERRIAIPCKWAFLKPPESKNQDTLWVLPIGLSQVWVRFPNGIIVGAEMHEHSFPSNAEELFTEGLDGRIDFTVDEMRSMRRAILALKPMRVEDGAGLGFTPRANGITIRGEEAAIEVAGRGDAGDEILLAKNLLQKAATIQDLLSFEFKKGDPEYRVRFTGRDVSVAIASCDQPV
jgi:hypothetical protein